MISSPFFLFGGVLTVSRLVVDPMKGTRSGVVGAASKVDSMPAGLLSALIG